MKSAKKEEMAAGEPAPAPPAPSTPRAQAESIYPIAALSFRVAKTMPECPHEYTVRSPENEVAYVALFNLIGERGVVEKWGRWVHLNKRHKSSTGLTMVNESAVTSVFAAIEPARVYVGLLAVRRQPEFSCNLPSATMLALFSSPLL